MNTNLNLNGLMQLTFAKYQAHGNDFIIINNFQNPYYIYDPMLTQQLCHRQFGIGADGIITIEKKAGYDFALLHYNADGSKGGGLCGNGSSSAIHYAQTLGIIDQKARFMAIDGPHTGYMVNDLVYLSLQDVASIEPLNKGYYLNNGTRHYVEMVGPIQTIDMEAVGLRQRSMHLDSGYFLDNFTGHQVEMVGPIQAIDMQAVGFPRRNMHPFEKEGININFAQLIAKDTMLVRTCECGLTEEPLSCGTGAVASALVASAYYGLDSPINVVTKGGKMRVTFKRLPDGRFSDIHLVGRVYQSFHGTVNPATLPPITTYNGL